MDSYPDDLLAGVFPLVFAVDAILPASPPPLKNEDGANNMQVEGGTESENAAHSTRSLFDRFLDAIATSLNEEEQDKPMNRTGSDTIASLLRGEDKDDSSDDDDDRSQDSSRRSFRRNSPMQTFRGNNKKQPSGPVTSMAYARVLSSERFFQRARILSISTKHGFPPSKDPDGSQNRALVLSQNRVTIAHCATGANVHRLKSIVERQVTEGILPAGWLEKHVHALPSVLVVVTTLSADASSQEAQNNHLLETVEHLKYNLAPKRNCHLHVVCLVQDPAPSILATDSWLTLVKHHTELPSTSFSLLSVKDLEPDMAVLSPLLRDLHDTIRDASLSYYLKQARRAKHKHSVLGHERQPSLLPQAARYCFKIGVFYEFQLKHEKSLKFFALAYQHVQAYYQFLLGGSPPVEMNPQDMEVKAAAVQDGDEAGIEVALADASDDDEEEEDEVAHTSELKRVISGDKTPSDMPHQCRAVADWLNFKLLQAAFMATALGAKDEGLLAASWQWRKHAQVMLRYNSEDISNPDWNYWAYVAHQRLVMAQLVERHPPSDDTVQEEILLRCSPWRNYLAVAEAELMLDAEIRKEASASMMGATKQGGHSMRKRFVGDLDSDGLSPKLAELAQQDHAEKALQLTLRAIELFEQESSAKKAESEESEEEETANPFLPSGARIYYVAGGILLGMKRYQDAIPHLERAASFCSEWECLERSIRKMLVECFSHYLPSLPPDVSPEAADAKMLGILFYSGLPLADLKPVIDSYATRRESESLKWSVESTSDADTSRPFSFSVTFPTSTHSTAGDTVTAGVTIKSNLNYPLHVKSVTLESPVGKISVPSNDLMDARGIEKRTDEGVILAPMAAAFFSTDIALPRDLDKFPSEVGNSGSAAPAARPRTSGITSAAGARLVPEDSFGSEEHNGQWSKTLLGGKPLLCNRMSLRFTPFHGDASSGEDVGLRFVDVQITKKKPKSVAPPKRTPFEESNYIESAWARPECVPFARGPQCLRVLGPMPHMIVTNLTNASVNGKALEGTVNRFIFKLEAGAGECCFDIDYRVTCSTTLVSKSDGSTTHLNPEEGVPPSTEGEVDFKAAGKRTPVIVSPDETGSGERSTDFGYDVPPGWRLEGTGHASDKVLHHVRSLKAGECTYICFELYRPARTLQPLENPYDSDKGNAKKDDDAKICQTNFDISITYKQSRPAVQKGNQNESEYSDSVVLEHSGSVVWESPLLADFSVDVRSQRAFPSGSRHPSNYLSASEADKQAELALINGERTSARCSLSSNVADDGLGIEIARIGFEERDISLDDGESACELHLQTSRQSATPGVLFTPDANDASRILTSGSKFGLSYSVKPVIKEQYLKGSVTTRLGVIWVDWYPVSVPLPEDIAPEGSSIVRLGFHGPLRLSEPPTLKFRGPPCYIEDAPFETVLESLPPSPRVATPFKMSYRIANKTGIQQKLSVLMSDQSTDERERSLASEGVLVSGLINGDITLAPFETQTLSYTALATKAGKTTMPALAISSDRYKTWLVKDQQEGSREIFVLP